jgi:alkylmercury lyase
MTLEEQVRRGAAVIGQYDELGLIPQLARLLAAGGEPVTVAQLGEAGGWAVDDVRARLARQGSVEWDDEGRIVGFGITLRPTPHRFTFDGRTDYGWCYGWCASDALTFSVLLDTEGVVESTCPVTGQPIRVEVTPVSVRLVDPPGAVVSAVRPERRVADVGADICSLGSFFSSRQAAAGWLAAHPEGQLNSVAEDFELHRLVLHELGWVHR